MVQDFPEYDPEIARKFGMDVVNTSGQLFGIPFLMVQVCGNCSSASLSIYWYAG